VVRKHNNTRFPLSGVHASLKCESCHLKGGIFQVVSIPVECVSCPKRITMKLKDLIILF
jgi:ribosomal protein S27E